MSWCLTSGMKMRWRSASAGWTCSTRILDEELALDTDGLANVRAIRGDTMSTWEKALQRRWRAAGRVFGADQGETAAAGAEATSVVGFASEAAHGQLADPAADVGGAAAQ